jgi:hypothetical protein
MGSTLRDTERVILRYENRTKSSYAHFRFVNFEYDQVNFSFIEYINTLKIDSK